MLKTAIIGTDSPIGLTVVRELGERGVPVHALGKLAKSIGAQSRYAQQFTLIPAGPITEWLPDFVARNDIGAVMAISERTLVELAPMRGTIPNCIIIAPEPDKFALVLDKNATLVAAHRAGLDTPCSWQPEAAQDHCEQVRRLAYPVAVKWSDPVAMIAPLASAELPLEKVEYASGPSELLAILAKYDPLGNWPMVQEYVGGYGFGQMLHMHDGATTLKFQHRRLREWPPSGGVSTYCASVPLDEHQAQMALSERLLQLIGWEGPAMVEYRYNPANGRYCLMEINGRLWGSIPLAYHCGAKFAWETWRCSVGLLTEDAPILKQRFARYLVPDSKHLFDQLRCSELPVMQKLRLLASFTLRFLDPRARYYVWSWQDPRPFLSDVWSMLRKALRVGSGAPAPEPPPQPAEGTLP